MKDAQFQQHHLLAGSQGEYFSLKSTEASGIHTALSADTALPNLHHRFPETGSLAAPVGAGSCAETPALGSRWAWSSLSGHRGCST